MPQNAFFLWTCNLLGSQKMTQRHSFSTLHPLSMVIYATATVLAFVLLCNSRFNFHGYTQREATSTHKSARKCAATSRDFLHERLQSAFTLANQLRWIAQYSIYACEITQKLWMLGSNYIHPSDTHLSLLLLVLALLCGSNVFSIYDTIYCYVEVMCFPYDTIYIISYLSSSAPPNGHVISSTIILVCAVHWKARNYQRVFKSIALDMLKM